MHTIDTVQAIYAAFGRGDVDFILSQLSDDIEWEYDAPDSDVPWLQPRRGKDGAQRFFQELGNTMDIQSFQVTRILGDAQLAVGLVDIAFVVKRTGKRVQERDEVHLWHFDANGKVSRFRHRIDTLTQSRACSP
ncbi:hypothetical protein C7S18_01715 [Ahniella affigens]|uniref:SnoaL-like domain-containing protein n=1 Tax=Ahniella affigens TaxID=2021234 RepID=A0A2P1PMC1_9GAMM|nr:nuclear transport factor 2 family protein [Ahniella affigens]AVP95985.1 hypothetical protein C7S18_01715 [Ahniella affigens]